jgi:nuclear pore complex protein Nup133
MGFRAVIHAMQAILNSAFEHREHHLATYGIELPMIRPWTSKPAIIDIVLGLFESSTAVISPSEYADSATQQHTELRAQLPDLAAVLFACLKERLDWLARYVCHLICEYPLTVHTAQ